MRVKFLGLLIFGIFILSCMTLPQEEIKYERIVEFDGYSADELYKFSLKWLAENFNDSKDVIEYQNEEDHEIVGTAYVTVPYNFVAVMPTKCNLTIQTKDNKVRVIATDMRMYNPTSWASSLVNTEGELSKFNKSLDSIVDRFESRLSHSNSDW